MPAAIKKIALKDSTLKSLKPAPAGTRRNVWDSLFPNLCVRVTDKGVRSFYIVKRLAGATAIVWHRLGQYPAMTLAEAPEAARAAYGALGRGEHPRRRADAKRQAAAAAAA